MGAAATAQIRIGTSGWHYAHWRGAYYPPEVKPADMLAYYAREFDAVELNNSFYRLPTVEALASWRDTVPAGFCFAAKASRYLTHMKKLRDPAEPLALLIPRLEVLGERLGPVLFQLPPRWGCDAARLAAFLAALPAGHRYAVEFRDTSWHVPAVYDLLARHGVAFCAYELAGVRSETPVTADFAYVRLHGPTAQRYAGSYDARALGVWARRIEGWARRLAEVHVYFDNDQAGYAVHDARALRAMVLGKRNGRRAARPAHLSAAR